MKNLTSTLGSPRTFTLLRSKRLPAWLFGGLFCFYGMLVLLFSPDQLRHDEPRYFTGAHYLTQGKFVDSEDPDFTNGPGYPLLLAPLMSLLDFEFERLIQDPEDHEFYLPNATGEYVPDLKGKLLPLRILNPFFLVAGFWILYRTARLFLSREVSLAVILALALNPFQLRFVPYLMTENVTPLLFGVFAWAYLRLISEKRLDLRLLVLAGLAFGWLALTRTMFGYVALVALLTVPIFCLIDRQRDRILPASAPFAIALGLCLPYLAYTHHHTGKHFYWASNGPELLYWITSPHEGEYGSWLQEKWIVDDPLLSANHLAFVREVAREPVLEQEAIWKKGIRENLQHPDRSKALLRNYTANLSRIFFNVPRSRKFENFPKLVWTLTGAVIAASIALSLLPTFLRWRQVPVGLKLLLMVTGIYLCGVFLLPAEPRYLVPVFPALFLWIAFVAQRLLDIRIRLRPANEI